MRSVPETHKSLLIYSETHEARRKIYRKAIRMDHTIMKKIAVLLMVVMLGAAINKISASTATLLFVLFSLVNGASLGTIFLCYAEASIFMVFGLTALIFGGMALYGYTTSSDLTKYSTLFMFGLIGIIVVSLINFFLNSPMLYTAISAFGVLLFIGLPSHFTNRRS